MSHREMSRRLVIFLFTFVLLGVYSSASQAVLLNKPVASYPLQCDQYFDCPLSLQGRVSFWVEVFGRWETDTAIFHDKNKPQRVYSTLRRENGCRHSRAGDSMDKRRKYLKKLILNTADKVQKRQSLSNKERQLAKMFEGETIAQMRKSADSIRCQSGNKDRMLEAIGHFSHYQPTIYSALQSSNLPTEFQYLPFVESAFNPNAVSHVGAGGLWQIMPSTGRKLGLLVNDAVDERFDPYRASYAAARYFTESVEKLTQTANEKGLAVTEQELNPFVITSYNYGVRGMQRAIEQVGLDYEKLLTDYRSPNFQTAVKNFYASFLAARYVAKNADQFYSADLLSQQKKVEYSPSPQSGSYTEIELKQALSVKRLSSYLGISSDQIERYNPSLKSRTKKHQALITKGFRLKLPMRAGGWASAMDEMYRLPQEYERPGYVWHKVKRGQTACAIAERYKTSCRGLRKLNRLNKKATIYVGQKLKVPQRGGGGIYTRDSSNQIATAGTYRVQSGDTACGIANRNGVSCQSVLSANSLTRKSTIRVGQKLQIPGSKASSPIKHRVAQGQSACQIARLYKRNCQSVLNANGLSRSATIYAGQTIVIPAEG